MRFVSEADAVKMSLREWSDLCKQANWVTEQISGFTTVGFVFYGINPPDPVIQPEDDGYYTAYVSNG